MATDNTPILSNIFIMLSSPYKKTAAHNQISSGTLPILHELGEG